MTLSGYAAKIAPRRTFPLMIFHAASKTLIPSLVENVPQCRFHMRSIRVLPHGLVRGGTRLPLSL
ncbi:hypothetical protein LCGC14_0843070 [marine sediment metagenome]|uniref:Uncharacterized protein n=1 Tax=marine sediment metagenome TaxID=412755 RepID=A0A0F9SJP4_9ZZZZ